MEKDVGADEDDEESNMEAKEAPPTSKEKVPEKLEKDKAEGEPSSTTEEDKGNNSNEPQKPMFPGTTDLNTRIRKLITAYQRYFKKEEVKNAQKAKVIYNH